MKTTVEINRNILGALLSFSAKANQPIDFDSALSYPLSPIPLSLALPDGARRETPKSKLMEIILKGASELSDPTVENPFMRRSTAYVLDMIATIRMMKSIPATYEDFTWQFLKMIPKNFKRVDIVADTYRDNSIKSGERLKRGCSSKVIIGLCNSKIPREFSKFMQNGEMKIRLIEIISEVIIYNKEKALKKLQTKAIYISKDQQTICITEQAANEVQELTSNQEEADTKLILHSLHALASGSSVILRSPSGDTDIMVIAFSIIRTDSDRLYVNYGSGQHRKGLLLNRIG